MGGAVVIILFCYGVILAIAGATTFLVGSVVSLHFAGIHALAIVCPDCGGSGDAPGGRPGQECPTCQGAGHIDDDGDAWDRARDRVLDRDGGVW